MNKLIFFCIVVGFILSLTNVQAVWQTAYNGTINVNVGEDVEVTIGNPTEFEVLGKCINNEEKCEGTINFLCVNNKWINKGQVNGKCGYSSGGGGPTGGGGTPALSGETGALLPLTTSSLSNGVNIIKKGINYSFSQDSGTHILFLEDVGDNYVWVNINSEPKRVKLKIDEAQEIDLDNNEINDISIKLISIQGDKIQIEYHPILKAEYTNLSDLSNGKEGITGAVTGTFGGTGVITAVVFIILVIGILVFISLRKNVHNKK